MRRSSWALLSAVVLFVACDTTLSHAADLRNVLTGYSVTSWGSTDGLPSSEVWSIAQDREGYLWLGTDAGLVRFDGVQFVSWAAFGPTKLPNRPVRVLCLSRDGSLWIGFGDDGGVSHVKAAVREQKWQASNYDEADGLGRGAITTIVEDHRGTIWAGNQTGLYSLSGNRWSRETSAPFPNGPIHSSYVDERGHLFVSTSSGVLERSSEGGTFHRIAHTLAGESEDDVVRSISVDAAERIWMTHPTAAIRTIDQGRVVTPLDEKGRGGRLLHDTAGNLWVGTWGQGLWRVQHDVVTGRSAAERLTALTGLLGNGVVSLLQDREGNIWAGTLDGLNRLTPHKTIPLTNLGLVAGVELTGESVWVATADELTPFKRGVPQSDDTWRTAGRTPISAVHADASGSLWFALGGELFRLGQGQVSALPLKGIDRPREIQLVTSDRHGGLWLYDARRGLIRWRAGRLQPGPLPSDPQDGRAVWMDTQRDGSLWLAFADGRLVVVDPDGWTHRYGKQDGLDGGVYRAFYEDREGAVWLGGTMGLTRFSNGRFATLHLANAYPLRSLTAIVEDHAGYLWLGTYSGIVRISPREFDEAISRSRSQIHYTLYAKSDGLAGNPRWYGKRGAIRAPDGRLWFVTSRGVTIVDPQAVQENHQPVRARIEAAVADRRPFDLVSEGVLPPGTRTLEIGFGALALTSPPMIHFQYRLEGFDSDWTEAGTRRQASYTNLPPGKYRFQVLARSADTTWNDSGAAWEFQVQPMFYQTWWFLASCILGFGLIVGAVWYEHVRQVRRRFSLLLAERARLSREIHDTLLQGLFGVALRCDAIASEAEVTAPQVKDHFVCMRKDLEEYIREARQSIWNLRSPKVEHQDLAGTLREVGAHATAATRIKFTFAATGTPRPCSPAVVEQLLRISREALFNTMRHAHASEIRMDLRYEQSSMVLSVTDNGLGFDPGRVDETDGHYGLTTMRERAEAVGGTFRISSNTSRRGTEVETSVPYV